MVTLQSESTSVQIAPEVGGRITHFVDRRSGYDFLWRNRSVPLRREATGAEYDPNFFGGIDELLPNDIPETLQGVECPDHGELWTSEFHVDQVSETELTMQVHLPLIGFQVSRSIRLLGQECRVATTITNLATEPRPFLWKLHAALAIEPGDTIWCPAREFSVADPNWSRRQANGAWKGETVPPFDSTTEFLYLHGLEEGMIGWRRDHKSFEVHFDPSVFLYAWYFASYGGFDGHHVAILEPATAMPISVNEAAQLGQCSVLNPGERLESTYSYIGVVRED